MSTHLAEVLRRKWLHKDAFQPAQGQIPPPNGGAGAMPEAMMGGGMPGNMPGQGGGMPMMDPSAMNAMPPMGGGDPSGGAGGQPPMLDPSMMMAPPGGDPGAAGGDPSAGGDPNDPTAGLPPPPEPEPDAPPQEPPRESDPSIPVSAVVEIIHAMKGNGRGGVKLNGGGSKDKDKAPPEDPNAGLNQPIMPMGGLDPGSMSGVMPGPSGQQ